MTPGDLLNSRYRLDDRIASGGMGEVWRAVDTVLGRPVAVKLMHADLHNDATFSARFRAEARTMAALHHPGIVGVYDYGELSQSDGTDLAYLVMAFVEGETLTSRLAATGPMSPAATMAMVVQAALALDVAHAAGIVHRDVKPENLLIDEDDHVVLVDFGVAHTSATMGLTGANEVIGTALYMAPEQITKQEISPAVDIYALGSVAYHCLTGSPPFVGESAISVAMQHLREDPAPLPVSVPQAVSDVVTTAMAKDPMHRYASAADMAYAAEAAERSARTGSPVREAVPLVVPEEGPPAALSRTSPLPYAAGVAHPVEASQHAESLITAPRSAPSGRRKLVPVALTVVLLGLIGAAVAITMALISPGTASPAHGTGTTSPVTAKSGHPVKSSAPSTRGTTKGSPGTPSKSLSPSTQAATTPATTTSTAPATPPVNPTASSTTDPAPPTTNPPTPPQVTPSPTDGGGGGDGDTPTTAPPPSPAG